MGLTAMEDADLRRLASFDRIGFLDPSGQAQLQHLRARDRRGQIREVGESVEQLAPLRHLNAAEPVRCSIYPG